MNTQEALKMAIEALEQAKEQLEKYWDEDINRGYDIEEMDDSPILLCEDTINACKEALEAEASEKLIIDFGDGTKAIHAGYSNDENKTPSLVISKLGAGVVGEDATHENLTVINDSDVLVELYFHNINSLGVLLKSVYEVYELNKLPLPNIGKQSIPLYTHPAQSWQGLADDKGIVDFSEMVVTTEFTRGAFWAEQKLKEKNT
jgi:hypothetical protein